MARVALKGITKRFGAFEALKSIDLDVQDGEFLSLLGPSGCGKTTMLRIVAGLETPTTGDVYFDAERVTELSPGDRDIAMVFQLYALYPYMNIRDNLAFPLRSQRMSRAEITVRVARAAKLMQVESILDRQPSEVHPADGQRVAIAKAIIRDPRVFLFDEPLSRLDAQMRARMRAELKRLHDTVGKTTLFVTHDQSEALAISDRVAVMRQGELAQLGAPEDIFHRPTDQYVAEFVGSPPINIFNATPVESNGEKRLRIAGQEIRLDHPSLANRWGDFDRLTAAIRPRYVRATGPDAENALMGKVEVIEPMGRETLAHIRLSPDVEARCFYARDATLREGEPVGVRFDARRVLLFDPLTGAAIEETP